MENLREENKEHLQTQKVLGKVRNAFAPDAWENIQRFPDCKDLFMCIYSMDGIHWELGFSAPIVVEEQHKNGYHVVILHPEFDLRLITDPIQVRSLNDPD